LGKTLTHNRGCGHLKVMILQKPLWLSQMNTSSLASNLFRSTVQPMIVLQARFPTTDSKLQEKHLHTTQGNCTFYQKLMSFQLVIITFRWNFSYTLKYCFLLQYSQGVKEFLSYQGLRVVPERVLIADASCRLT